MLPFWNQVKDYRLGITLSALGLLILGASILPEALWADMLMPIHSASPVQEALEKPKVMTDADLIRVGISDDAMTTWDLPSVTLSATGGFTLSDKASGKVIQTLSPTTRVRVTRNNQGFWLQVEGQKPQGPYWNVIVAKPLSSDSRLTIPSITRRGVVPSYKGIFELVSSRHAEDKLTVVNVLPMQEYLKAVVPNELPFRYGLEAVKAQSVAARNYAIRPREKSWFDFDICDSQYCQAYYGAHTEDPKVSGALAQTQGLVALYQGEPILALYSSSHAGVADSYANVFSDPKTNQFPAPPIEYLVGGPDSGTAPNLSEESAIRSFLSRNDVESFDRTSPMFRWNRTWTRSELEGILNQNLRQVSNAKDTASFVSPAFLPSDTLGELKGLDVLTRSPAGKIMRLAVRGTNGTWTLTKEFVIRKVLQHNGRFLPSATVVFTPQSNSQGRLLSIQASGGGFGHGVGMSQIGASTMAQKGQNFVGILQHYYKGVAIGPTPLKATRQAGQETHFFVTEPKGTLVVQNPNPVPVYFRVNTTRQMVPPSSVPVRLSASKWLKANQVNTLAIEPIDMEGPEPSRLWLELYAPH